MIFSKCIVLVIFFFGCIFHTLVAENHVFSATTDGLELASQHWSEWKFTLPNQNQVQPFALRFLARIVQPEKIGKQYVLEIQVNGQPVTPFVGPENSGITRLLNRASPTFHGTAYPYFYKNGLNVASNLKEEYIEIVYCPADYDQVFFYRLDLSDLLKPGENIIRFRKKGTEAPLLLSKCALETFDPRQLPDAALRTFRSASKVTDIILKADGGIQQIKLPEIPVSPGENRVLRFRARLNAGNGWGCSNDLLLSVNGKIPPERTPQGGFRLLNREISSFLGRKNPSYTSVNGSVCILHHNDFQPPVLEDRFPENERNQAFWSYIDLEDLLPSSAETILEFRNRAQNRNFKNYPPETPTLSVNNVEIGYVKSELCHRFSDNNKAIRQSAPGHTLTTPLYTLNVQPAGGLEITCGQKRLFIDSGFTYPKRGENQLQCAGVSANSQEKEWHPEVKRTREGLQLKAKGASYELTREILCQPDAIRIRDTIQNLTSDILGLRAAYFCVPDSSPKAIYRNGAIELDNWTGTHKNPAPNSTLFFSHDAAGFGVAVEDDVFRLQCEYKVLGQNAKFQTEHLGIAAGKSYTLEWSIYPMKSSDYFDFINLVRRDWGVNNRTISGAIGWPGNYGMGKPKNQSFENLGIIYDFLYWFNLDRAPEPGSTVESLLRPYRARCEKLRQENPNLVPILMIQAVLSWRTKEGEPDPFADSCQITPAGNPAWYTASYRGTVAGERHVRRYFTQKNRYFRYAMETVRVALDMGIGGFYFDTPNHLQEYYGRFSFDQWDGHTVDLDPFDFTVTAKYADLCLVSGPARAELIRYVLDRGGRVFYNNPPIRRELQKISGELVHFTEGDRTSSLARMHLSTPVTLGEHYLNSAPTQPLYGRRKSWHGARDFMDDIRWKLQNGLLYYTYRAPRADEDSGNSSLPLKHEWPLKYMYPITVSDIHSNWVRGKERIVTAQSGLFRWNNSVSKATLRSFDREGYPQEPQELLPDSEGNFAIEVPPEGISILINGEN